MLKRAVASSPSYQRAVAWIAVEDEPEDMDVESIECTVSVCLVADLWAKAPIQVAADVLRE